MLYSVVNQAARIQLFQTKLTYGMICYPEMFENIFGDDMFQTKLTYGMICYGMPYFFFEIQNSFKLSWLMVWFVIAFPFVAYDFIYFVSN